MRNTLVALFPIILPLLSTPAAAQWLLQHGDTRAAFRPVEVAAEKGFIIHAIPRNTDRGFMAQWMLAGNDYILTHTSLPDGKLKVLMRSGHYSARSVPKGMNTIAHHKTEFLGIAVWGNRLIVLTRHFHHVVTQTSKDPTYGKPQYWLTLFDTRDGEKLSELALHQVKVPEVARLREIGPGPLTVKQEQISLWGRTVRIDQHGRMILQSEAAKPQK